MRKYVENSIIIFTGVLSFFIFPTIGFAEGKLSDIYSIATTTFTTSVGFAYSDVTGWSDTMIKLLLGSSLGILSYQIRWIIAFLVFSTIIFFIYRGFRFFRY